MENVETEAANFNGQNEYPPTARSRLRRHVPTALMWALAVFFALWSLRGAAATDITLNDQARHALNGVALLDMVRDGAVGRPVAYLRDYFSHFPAISMPYHPPLFPAIEAVFYAVFGIRPAAARLAVSVFVAGSVLLLL